MPAKIVDVTKSSEAGKDLPATQCVKHVEYEDPENGRRHSGEFVIRRLNLGLMRQVSVRKAELNGGMPHDSLDPATRQLNSLLAHLEFAILKAPEWWKPEEFYSGDLIAQVYEEVMNFEDSFRRPVPKQPQGAEGDRSSAAGQPGAHAQAMVGEEVRAAPHA